MKRLLCCMLVLLLGVGALAEGVPGNRLGLELLADLWDGEGNQFVSPVSLACALSMAAAGADGATRDELLAALDARDAADIARLNDALAASGLRWANAAFIRESVALYPDYAEALASLFAAERLPLDDPERVNAWVSAHTDGLIDHLVEGLDPNLLLMLVNAVAMDAKWAIPFDEAESCEGDFSAPAGRMRATYMRLSAEYMEYGEVDGTQQLRLDYADSDLYMLIALPPAGEMRSALAALAEKGLDYFDVRTTSREVNLRLPRLDVEVSNPLTGLLIARGLALPFGDAADFSGMSATQLYISNILQKVRVEVDEQGTRAAAVTGMFMDGASAMPEEEPPIWMIVDRPYILVIADEATGAICFAGAVAAPEAEGYAPRSAGIDADAPVNFADFIAGFFE